MQLRMQTLLYKALPKSKNLDDLDPTLYMVYI
jgi:hypothetical protein